MTNSTTESVLSTTTNNLNTRIPIFIGQRKTLVKSTIKFVDNTCSSILLPTDVSNQIDSDSIKLSIKYWKTIFSSSFNNATNPLTQVLLNASLPVGLDSTCLFVVFDSNNNILFSTTIDKIISTITTLDYIILHDALILTGTLNIALIKSVTENLSYALSGNIILVNYDNKISCPDYSYVSVSKSTISYILKSTQFNSIIYKPTDITQDVIDNELNYNIKQGLIASKTTGCIIINYIDQLGDLFDFLDQSLYGYSIVTIDLDSSTINNISNYVKNREYNNRFYTQINPVVENVFTKILLTATTVRSGMS